MAGKLALLALAGALGTLARYGTGLLVERHATGLFPWPTFTVNMIGCFFFGLIYAIAEERTGWTGTPRIIILTGFMGAYTTYSTFAFNTTTLIRDAQWMLAAANILSQNILGIVCLFIGIALGKLL